MKRLYYIAASLLILVGAASCEKQANNLEQSNQDQQQTGQGKMIPFSVTAGQGGKKTSMVNGILSWTKGDEITVMTQAGTYPTELTLKGDGGSATGEFSGEIADAVADNTELYGMFGATFDGTNFSVAVPATQTYTEGSFQPGTFPSIGTGTYKKNGATEISFNKMPMGVLRIRLKGISTVTGLKLKSADKNLSGTFSVTTEMAVSGGSGKEITMTLPATGVELNMSETASEQKMFCFVVPPATYDTNDTVIINFKDGRTYKRVFSTTVTVNGGNASTETVCDPCENTIPTDYVNDEKVTDICGNTYNTIKIGDQIWMKENLRCNKYDTQSTAYNASWLTSNTLPTSKTTIYKPYYTDATDKTNWQSTTYAGNLSNEQIAKLGYLYNWAAAVGVADGFKQKTDLSENWQGICPDGWHVPSSAEFDALRTQIEVTEDKGSDKAGKYLKNDTGWHAESGIENLNCYGFAALPAGGGAGSKVGGVGIYGWFWTATKYESDNFYAYNGDLSYNEDYLAVNFSDKSNGRVVRCLKN